MLTQILHLIEKGYRKLFGASNYLKRWPYLRGNLLLSLIFVVLTELLKKTQLLSANIILANILLTSTMLVVTYYSSRAFIARLRDIGLSTKYFFAAIVLYSLLSLKFMTVALIMMCCWHMFVFITPGRHTHNHNQATSTKPATNPSVFIA